LRADGEPASAGSCAALLEQPQGRPFIVLSPKKLLGGCACGGLKV
jgi:hypothetical protein